MQRTVYHVKGKAMKTKEEYMREAEEAWELYDAIQRNVTTFVEGRREECPIAFEFDANGKHYAGTVHEVAKV